MTELAGPATHSVREEAVELAALSWFDLIGWRTVSGEQLAPDGPIGARSDYRQTILEPELRSALAALNGDATPAMIDNAVRAILVAPSQDLKENNRSFHKLLSEGLSVEAPHLGEGRWEPIKVFDRDELSANRWLVANQFVVQGDREVIRPDLVTFVNGLPLAVLELKSPVAGNATLETAFTQLQNYKNKVPELFRTNQILVISDGIHARVGSLTAGYDRFGPWRTIDGVEDEDAGRPELEVLIRGVFAHERFLDLICDFIAFEVEDGVVKSKELAAYHQRYPPVAAVRVGRIDER